MSLNFKSFIKVKLLLAIFIPTFLLFFGISGSKAKKNKSAPSGLLSFLEPLVLFVRDDIVKPNIGKNYQKYLPYLLTLFFFILMNNHRITSSDEQIVDDILEEPILTRILKDEEHRNSKYQYLLNKIGV